MDENAAAANGGWVVFEDQAGATRCGAVLAMVRRTISSSWSNSRSTALAGESTRASGTSSPPHQAGQQSCAEVAVFADLLAALGDTDAARTWLAEHGNGCAGHQLTADTPPTPAPAADGEQPPAALTAVPSARIDTFTLAPVRPDISFHRSDGALQVRIHTDTGELEYGDGYTPNAAARVFWETMAAWGCPASTEHLQRLDVAALWDLHGAVTGELAERVAAAVATEARRAAAGTSGRNDVPVRRRPHPLRRVRRRLPRRRLRVVPGGPGGLPGGRLPQLRPAGPTRVSSSPTPDGPATR